MNGGLVAVLVGVAAGGALYLARRKANATDPCTQALVSRGVPLELAAMGCAAAGDPVGTVKAVNGVIQGVVNKVGSAVSFGVGGKGSVDNRCDCPPGLTSKAADAVSGPLIRDHFNDDGALNGNPRVCVDAKGVIQGVLDINCNYRPYTASASPPPPVSSYQQPGTSSSYTGTRDHRH